MSGEHSRKIVRFGKSSRRKNTQISSNSNQRYTTAKSTAKSMKELADFFGKRTAYTSTGGMQRPQSSGALTKMTRPKPGDTQSKYASLTASSSQWRFIT